MRRFALICLAALCFALPAQAAEPAPRNGASDFLALTGIMGGVSLVSGLLTRDGQAMGASGLASAFLVPLVYDNATGGDGPVGASMIGALGGGGLMLLLTPSKLGQGFKLFSLGAGAMGGAAIGYAVGTPLTVTPTMTPDGEKRAMGLSFSGRF